MNKQFAVIGENIVVIDENWHVTNRNINDIGKESSENNNYREPKTEMEIAYVRKELEEKVNMLLACENRIKLYDQLIEEYRDLIEVSSEKAEKRIIEKYKDIFFKNDLSISMYTITLAATLGGLICSRLSQDYKVSDLLPLIVMFPSYNIGGLGAMISNKHYYAEESRTAKIALKVVEEEREKSVQELNEIKKEIGKIKTNMNVCSDSTIEVNDGMDEESKRRLCLIDAFDFFEKDLLKAVEKGNVEEYLKASPYPFAEQEIDFLLEILEISVKETEKNKVIGQYKKS